MFTVTIEGPNITVTADNLDAASDVAYYLCEGARMPVTLKGPDRLVRRYVWDGQRSTRI